MVPSRISEMMRQLGRGLSGALVYVGAGKVVYQDREPWRSSQELPNGLVRFDVGIAFPVNGKRGQGWKIVISLEPCDTYTVYLCRRANRKEQAAGKLGVVMKSQDDVYCDVLQQVVEATYDNAIREKNGGFIPLS
jgi:hypothetical protein